MTTYADGDVSEVDADGACAPPPLDWEEYVLQTDDGDVASGGDVEAYWVAISARAERGQPDMMMRKNVMDEVNEVNSFAIDLLMLIE